MKTIYIVLFFFLNIVPIVAKESEENNTSELCGEWILACSKNRTQGKISIVHVEKEYVLHLKNDSTGINQAGLYEFNDFEQILIEDINYCGKIY